MSEQGPQRPKTALGEALRLLDIAVWGFAREPRRCSRCNCDEGDAHSPTCPMPVEVLEPLRALLGEPAGRAERWESYVDDLTPDTRPELVGATPDTGLAHRGPQRDLRGSRRHCLCWLRLRRPPNRGGARFSSRESYGMTRTPPREPAAELAAREDPDIRAVRIREIEQRVINAATIEAARELHYKLDVLYAHRDGKPRPKPPVRQSYGQGRVVNRQRDGRLRANRSPAATETIPKGDNRDPMTPRAETPLRPPEVWYHAKHGLHDEAHHQAHRPLDLCVPLDYATPERRAARSTPDPAGAGLRELAACASCGGPHQFDTSVPSPLWNRVIRDGGLPDYLCTTCIVLAFVKAGVSFEAELYGEAVNREDRTVPVIRVQVDDRPIDQTYGDLEYRLALAQSSDGSLDAAWKAAEKALTVQYRGGLGDLMDRKRYDLTVHRRYASRLDADGNEEYEYEARATLPAIHYIAVPGPHPAAALRSLVARLTEHSDTGEPG